MELYLAVAALFGGIVDLGINAASGDWDAPRASDIVPTALDVSTVLGQGALVAGKTGGLNWLGTCYPAGESAIEMSRLSKGTAATAEESVASVPLLSEIEQEAGGGLVKPPASGHIERHFASPLAILQAAINIVEWLIVPFFGFEIPDDGSQIEHSKDQFAQGYDALGLAIPDPTQWKGEAADAYTADTELLQNLAKQAGMDGLFAPLFNNSLDSELQSVIDRQAREIQLMRMALAIIVAGLTFCIATALAIEACAPGASLMFQIMMFIAAVGAALGVVITITYWAADNSRDLNRVADKYANLAEQVPLSVPSMPPCAESPISASAVSRFLDLNVSAVPDKAGAAGASNASGNKHARLHALAGLGGSSLDGQPAGYTETDEPTHKAPAGPFASVHQLAPSAQPSRKAETADNAVPRADVDNTETSAAEIDWTPVDDMAFGSEQISGVANLSEARHVPLPTSRTYKSTA